MPVADRDPIEIFEEYIQLMKDDCLDPWISKHKKELEAVGYSIQEVSESVREEKNHIVWQKTFILFMPNDVEIARAEHIEIRIARDKYHNQNPAKIKTLAVTSAGKFTVTAEDLQFLKSMKIDVGNLDPDKK